MKLVSFVAVFSLAASLLLVAPCDHAQARPENAANCAGCHSTQMDSFSVTGETRIDLGLGLKVFEVLQGGTTHLTANVTDRHGDQYGVALNNQSTLPFPPDPDWQDHTDGGKFGIDPYYSTLKEEVTAPWTFDLAIGPDAPFDMYLFEFQVAGGSSEWHDLEQFFVQVVPEFVAGDTDEDCDVDFTDFNNLANNYTGSLAPGTGGKEWGDGDFDGDQDVDFTDFNDLANHYTGPGDGCKGVPEPSTLVLVTMIAASLLPYALRRRKRVA